MLTSSRTGQDFGSKEMSAGLILGQFNPPRNHSLRTYEEPNGGSWTNAFHTYEVLWSPSKVQNLVSFICIKLMDYV